MLYLYTVLFKHMQYIALHSTGLYLFIFTVLIEKIDVFLFACRYI